MKRILYFDCSAGVSGDMTLGALLHLGGAVNVETLRSELGKLAIGGYEILPGAGRMNGVTGVNLDVIIQEQDRTPDARPAEDPGRPIDRDRLENHHRSADHNHDHDDSHRHNHDDGHSYRHDHDPDHGDAGGHRRFRDIRALIENSALNSGVKRMATDIFRVIAEAEAAVHDMPTEDVVFHEVGAVDSIVDIVGAAVCVDLLKPDRIYCSPVHDGAGFIRCRHGLIPVPVPAVMEMLRGSDIRIVTEDVPTEMVTPTGIGILKGLGARCVRMPEINVLGVGYGFGKRDTGRFNALRVVLGVEKEG